MVSQKTPPDTEKLDRIVAQARKAREQREKDYRERALKMFPPVCGRCGRDFSGKKLRELTVHHRDHNHDYNPPDGSNWELLCIYCHENEHSRLLHQDRFGTTGADRDTDDRALTHSPFAGLQDLLKAKK